MDYAMLSHHQIQSSSDLIDYTKYPSIVAGALAAVLPEQLGVRSYPKTDDDADVASFNRVNAMLARIHQSGNLANLKGESWHEVREGIRIYKENIGFAEYGRDPFAGGRWAARCQEVPDRCLAARHPSFLGP
jgi:alpha-galactosidase